MSLEDYSIEELRAEIKRRNTLVREQRVQVPRCRNCKHLMNHPHVRGMYLCGVRTWGKTYTRHYCVKLCTKACDKFELKINENKL